MKKSPVKNTKHLSLPWETQDPFIFCSYHHDLYPGNNDKLGPDSSLEGRSIGQDFAGKDGWNMYHGRVVPGFPAHPHCGFETISVVTKGMVDHSDSLGGKGRFGNGDVQWLTSGRGLQHAEMFPLLDEVSNPFEIFQIWINLPRKSKNVEPHYKMLWHENIPVIVEKDDRGNQTRINLIAGSHKGHKALNPAPDSWAADPANAVQIWTIKAAPHAVFTIPATEIEATRSLFFYRGTSISIGETKVQEYQVVELDAAEDAEIENGAGEGCFLFLQGRPINEPFEQMGPFVSNSQAEIREIVSEYQRTQFGGWPWPDNEPVHGKERGRFALYTNGEEEIK